MAKRKAERFTIDILMEGPGGSFIFKPVTVSPDDLGNIVKLSKANPIIRQNIERELRRRKGGEKILKKLAEQIKKSSQAKSQHPSIKAR